MCEKQSLAEMMKKTLNVNFLKLQQSIVDVKSLNVCVFFLDMCSSKISDLKKKIKEKNSVFVKVDAV